MLIGLTGGIATGKSTVSQMFKQCGAQIIDADRIARDVVQPGTIGAKKVAERFGEDFFDEHGKLNRPKLAKLIFQNEDARKDLNGLLHPLIRQEMRLKTKDIQSQQPKAIIIWDVPLLYEGQLTDELEKVIVVYVPEYLQIQRLVQRDHLSQEEAKKRISAQMPIEEKKLLADYLIDNSGSYKNTERQVDQLWNFLISKNGLNQP